MAKYTIDTVAGTVTPQGSVLGTLVTWLLVMAFCAMVAGIVFRIVLVIFGIWLAFKILKWVFLRFF